MHHFAINCTSIPSLLCTDPMYAAIAENMICVLFLFCLTLWACDLYLSEFNCIQATDVLIQNGPHWIRTAGLIVWYVLSILYKLIKTFQTRLTVCWCQDGTEYTEATVGSAVRELLTTLESRKVDVNASIRELCAQEKQKNPTEAQDIPSASDIEEDSKDEGPGW